MLAVDCLGMNIYKHLCIYVHIFFQILALGEKLTYNDYKSESVRKNY